MATVTRSFRENGGQMVDYSTPSEGATWTVAISGADYNVSDTSGTLTIADPVMTAKFVQYSSDAAKKRAYIDCEGDVLINNVGYLGSYVTLKKRRADGAAASGTTYTIAKRSDSSFPANIDITKVFNSNTPTLKTAAITLPSYYMWLQSYYSGSASSGTNDSYYSGSMSFGTIGYVYYKCPPEFTSNPTLTKNTSSGYYAGATTVTVSVPISYSSSGTTGTAKYGGYIKKIEFIIGTQTDTLTFEESTKPTAAKTLSIALSAVGPFTPKVIITDSRDQTATYEFSDITVEQYNVSAANVSVRRIDSSTFKRDDEGTNAVIASTFNYTTVSGSSLLAPTVTVGSTAATITWYTSWNESTGAFSGAVSNWPSVASGTTLYGKITNTFDRDTSYEINVTPRTGLKTGDTITTVLPQSFYLLVGRTGGHGLGIGKKPEGDYLDIGMEVRFRDELYLDVDQTASGSSTTDGELMDALTDLGWEGTKTNGGVFED